MCLGYVRYSVISVLPSCVSLVIVQLLLLSQNPRIECSFPSVLFSHHICYSSVLKYIPVSCSFTSPYPLVTISSLVMMSIIIVWSFVFTFPIVQSLLILFNHVLIVYLVLSVDCYYTLVDSEHVEPDSRSLIYSVSFPSSLEMFSRSRPSTSCVIVSYHAPSYITRYSAAYCFFGFNLPSNLPASLPIIFPPPRCI